MLADDYYIVLEREYKRAIKEIEKDISVWTQRFATNNQISLSDTRKWLNSKELNELRWDVNEYIKYAKENAINGKWIKELENASARVHISRLEAIELQIKQHIETLFSKQAKGLEKHLGESYKDLYYHSVYEIQKGTNIGFKFDVINKKGLDKVLSKPWTADNITFRDRCWTEKGKLIKSLQSKLTQGMMRGDSLKKMSLSISKEFDVLYYKAKRLVHTETANISSRAQGDSYKDVGIERYQILATLDSRTSAICQSLDLKIYDMVIYEPGVTAPPFHPNCRTTTIPYFDDEENYIGLRTARNKKGKTYYVLANITYDEWKNKYVV